VPLANPEPGAKLETLCMEHMLYVCFENDQGTLRRPVVLARTRPRGSGQANTARTLRENTNTSKKEI